MNDAPEPLRKLEILYQEITPFDDEVATRFYKDTAFEDGYIFGKETEKVRFERCTFKKVTFRSLNTCIFKECKFEHCLWEDRITNVHFRNCRLFQPDFTGTVLEGVELRNTEFSEPLFSNVTSFRDVALWDICGLETSFRLYDVHVDPGPNHAWQIELDGKIERLRLPWLIRNASWTRLRSFGKLPFFGVSYIGLATIPTVMYLISMYNDQIEHLMVLGERSGGIAALLAVHLHPIPVPSLNLLLLLSLVLLAVASTIFAIACPSRIKEFSYERWVDEFRRPGIQYLPLGWQYPLARTICGACYPLGALGAAAVLFWKVLGAATYIIQHSPMPWMLK